MYTGHSVPSVYDYLCEATNVVGFDASFKSGPTMEAKLISVGEHPMIALHKITKVHYFEYYLAWFL